MSDMSEEYMAWKHSTGGGAATEKCPEDCDGFGQLIGDSDGPCPACSGLEPDRGGAAVAAGVADARSHTPGNDLSFTEIQRNELAMARDKFPGNAHMMVALTEEVGEVARALLEQGPGSREVLEECAQVAAVAQRIATEGDGDFTATGQQEAVADSQPTPYAEAFRERVCPVPEFPGIEKEES